MRHRVVAVAAGSPAWGGLAVLLAASCSAVLGADFGDKRVREEPAADASPDGAADAGIDAGRCRTALDVGCECIHGETVACGTDVGECKSGERTCADGVLGPCEGATGPTFESCNGRDDDCDGTADEGCACVDGTITPCGTDVGECVAGTQKCAGGQLGPCEGAKDPAPETCNGLDDDCDGVVDPGCACVNGATKPCGSGGGVCSTTPLTCQGGQWPACAISRTFSTTDCKTVYCPACAPYLVGCAVTMPGGSPEGCVAYDPANPSAGIFVKEGTLCGSSTITGTLKCSSVPGTALSSATCPMKGASKPYFPKTPSGCP